MGRFFGLCLLCGQRFAEIKHLGDFEFNMRSRLRSEQNRTNGISAQSGRNCYKLPKGIVSMRTKLGNWTRMAVVVVAVFSTQSGCKSGWKMPGTDMFPWSKKPSESTLAGSSPSLSMPSNNPTSPIGPAYKNSPNPLASNAANPSRPTSPYGPSFNMPPNNPLASNGAGVSAGANGYSTGSYNMAGNANRPGGFTPPTGYGPPLQSPNGYGNPPPQNALAGLPPAYGGMPTGLPPSQNSSAAYAPMGNAGIPAMPAGYNAAAVNMPQGNFPQSSMPNALPSSFQSAGPNNTSGPVVATQNYNGAAPYRPGSVGRQTSYDFSNQGAGASALPPSSVPNTANQLPNGAANGLYR